METVAVYGGGNIAHSLVAVLSYHMPVWVVTRRPGRWSNTLLCEQSGTYRRSVFPVRATSDIDEIIDVDIVFVALPQFAIDETVMKLSSRLKTGTTVVFVPAPAKSEEYAERLVKIGINVVAFQRVPFISRICDYGSSVSISSPRTMHKLVVSDNCMETVWRERCRNWFGGDVGYLSSFVSFAFSNSNPLLHPARLCVLLNSGYKGTYDRCPLFYAEWTDESSELYVAADKEMCKAFKKYAPQVANADYESVLEHYDVPSPKALTQKIRSIASFRSILAPWKPRADGVWTPDFASRYFTEDVPYGTMVIHSLANRIGVATPIIDTMIATIQSHMAMVNA